MINEDTDSLKLSPFVVRDDAKAIELVDAIQARLRQLDGIAALGVSVDDEYVEVWSLIRALTGQSEILLDRLVNAIRLNRLTTT